MRGVEVNIVEEMLGVEADSGGGDDAYSVYIGGRIPRMQTIAKERSKMVFPLTYAISEIIDGAHDSGDGFGVE